MCIFFIYKIYNKKGLWVCCLMSVCVYCCWYFAVLFLQKKGEGNKGGFFVVEL